MADIDIVAVRVGRTVNIGNYESIRLEFEAKVHDGQDPEFVYAGLVKLCNSKRAALLVDQKKGDRQASAS